MSKNSSPPNHAVNPLRFTSIPFGRNGTHCVYGQTNIILSEDMESLTRFVPETVKTEAQTRKTKIICTMGPSCWDVDMIVKLMDEGMSVARLNFSHGDHAGHAAVVKNLKEAMAQRPGKHLAWLLDTKGPEIRTGFFREDVGKTIDLKAGQQLILTTDYSFKGDSTKIACTYTKLPQSVQPGGRVLVADGSLVLEVVECGEDEITCKVLNNCKIGERKNMNLPGVHVDLPVIGEKDKSDILDFAIPYGATYIAVSFVQSAADVRTVRALLGEQGKHIKIISKIENEAGMVNFDAILEETDMIMVARGDLGMEIPTEKVFLAQKMMIGKCNLAGKPVITATQMLESMCKNPRPTRAEATDVANAVLDGTDCVMLSGETAGGDFPVDAVTIMRRICCEAERVIDYNSLYLTIRQGVMALRQYVNIPESMASAAVKTAMDTNCCLIIAVTESGYTARMLAKYRPSVPILALAANENVIKEMMCLKGVIPVQVESLEGINHVIHNALAYAKDNHLCNSKDKIVVVHGTKEEMGGESNLIKVIDVE